MGIRIDSVLTVALLLTVSTTYAGMFRSVTVITNMEYVVTKPRISGCVTTASTGHVKICGAVADEDDICLAKSLAYVRVCGDHGLGLFVRNTILGSLSAITLPGPDAFPVNLYQKSCSRTDLTMIPFLVTDTSTGDSFRVCACRVSHDGNFLFALYANMTTLRASLDFSKTTRCKPALLGHSMYPFLDKVQVEQQVRVCKSHEDPADAIDVGVKAKPPIKIPAPKAVEVDVDGMNQGTGSWLNIL